MDRKIVIEVNGGYIRKDSDVAGVRGEANSTIMNIIFDESWEGYAKKVTFWDARGENPVRRTLTTDLLTDITTSILNYSVPIPGEPLAHEGQMTFVIEGYTDGVRKRTVSDKLKVKPSPIADVEGEPADPTPDQAEQLQKQIDTMLGDIQAERVQAQEARNEAVNAAEEATASAESASEANESAGVAMIAAVEAANVARDAEAGAIEAKEAAQKIKEEITEVAGGDFPTRTEAQGYANQAEANAKAYTDEQLTHIPTPDVSGQISEHNADADAHPAIRERINSLEEKVGDVVLSELDILDYEVVTKEEFDSMEKQEDVLYLIEDDPETQAVKEHIVNTDIHVTAEEKQKWNDVEASLEPGFITLAARNDFNEEWALCNGDALLKSEYPELAKKIEGLGEYIHKKDIIFSKNISFNNSEGTAFTATITEADIFDIYFCEETEETIVTCVQSFREGTTYYFDDLVILFYKKTPTGDFEFDLENWSYKIISKDRLYVSSGSSAYGYKGAITKRIDGRYIVLLGKKYNSSKQETYRANAVFSEISTDIESASTWTFNNFIYSTSSSAYSPFLPVLLDTIMIDGKKYTIFITQSIDSSEISSIKGSYWIYLIPDFASPSTFYSYSYSISGSSTTITRWFVHNNSLYLAYGTYNNDDYNLFQFTLTTSEISLYKNKSIETTKTVNPDGNRYVSFAFYEGSAGLYIFMTLREYSSEEYFEAGYFLIDTSGNLSGGILTTDLWVNGVFETADDIVIYTNDRVYSVTSESDLTDFSKWVEVGFTHMPYNASQWDNQSSLFCSAKMLKGTDGTAKIIPTPYIYFRDNFVLELNKYIKLPTLASDATILPIPSYWIKVKP